VAKFDDPLSARALIDPDGVIMVRAVESPDSRSDTKTEAALAAEGVVELTRAELQTLLAALDSPPGDTERPVHTGDLPVRAVDDEAHYLDHPPGAVYLPSSGEFR